MLKNLNCTSVFSIIEAEILEGLTRPQKFLPCKLFYDAKGSELFEQICELPEYYLTRTEIEIMRTYVAEMAACFPPKTVLIELGSGSGRKTNMLLDAAGQKIVLYVPVDISQEHLRQSVLWLQRQHPSLAIFPVCEDYLRPLLLPSLLPDLQHRVVYFPGSTIGNFQPEELTVFLSRVRTFCGVEGGFLVGIDLHKDQKILELAYNDTLGITAEFNLNCLHRLNREYGANFDLEKFRHQAIYSNHHHRIEMYLISAQLQKVMIKNTPIHFEVRERLCTEYSYKYDTDDFIARVESCGFTLHRCWFDAKKWFSIQYFRVSDFCA